MLDQIKNNWYLVHIFGFDWFLCRWNSCKQNKQGANNSSTNQNQTPSPEGEKLHSDSGISVDSQSLQEQQGQTQTHTGENTWNTATHFSSHYLHGNVGPASKLVINKKLDMLTCVFSWVSLQSELSCLLIGGLLDLIPDHLYHTVICKDYFPSNL